MKAKLRRPMARMMRTDSGEPADDPGADDLIRGQADDDRPLDVDWTSEALETDSFADVVTSSSGEEAFDFERIEYSAASLAEHLPISSTGCPGDVGNLARMIAETLDETGYLTVPLEQIGELTGASLSHVEQALAIVQGLDPAGVGARSLAECLALQAKAADRYDPAMARLIDNLELLSKGRTERSQAHLRSRRRRSRRHDPRAPRL